MKQVNCYPENGMPKSWIALIPQFVEDEPNPAAVARQQPGLCLIRTRFVTADGKEHQDDKPKPHHAVQQSEPLRRSFSKRKINVTTVRLQVEQNQLIANIV